MKLAELIESWRGDARIFSLEDPRPRSYADLHEAVREKILFWRERLPTPGAVALPASNSFASFVDFLALLGAGHVAFPLAPYLFADPAFRQRLEEETGMSFFFTDEGLPSSFRPVAPLIAELQTGGEAGFIIRTSGSSSARFKFILHSTERFLRKYQRRGPHFERSFAFSPADSIAGVETLLECLVHKAALVIAGDQPTPRGVCELIARHRVDYFQTTPSFLNLMVLTRQTDKNILSSLKKIAYGSEPSSPLTVRTLQKDLAPIELCHTYGMSEIGIQATHTNPEDASVFRLDQDLNPGRLRQGLIEIQSLTPMCGYLNVPTPEMDPWFRTHDRAREEGAYWRVLGREGDLINVAGRKFFPSELENLLMGLEGVGDVTVLAESNDLIGQALIAKFVLQEGIDEKDFRARLKTFAEGQLPSFMRPHKIIITPPEAPGGRFKKIRRV